MRTSWTLKLPARRSASHVKPRDAEPLLSAYTCVEGMLSLCLRVQWREYVMPPHTHTHCALAVPESCSEWLVFHCMQTKLNDGNNSKRLTAEVTQRS